MRTSVKRKRLGQLFQRKPTATVDEVVKTYHGEEELKEMLEKARKIDKSKWAREHKEKYGTPPISFEASIKAKAKVLADAAVMQLSRDGIFVENVTDPGDQFKAGIRVNSDTGEAVLQELQPSYSREASQRLVQKTVEKNNAEWERVIKAIDPTLRRKVKNFIAAQNQMASGMFDYEFEPTGTYAK